MAPPAKITFANHEQDEIRALEEEREPDVLPADFGEWDSGAPPTTLPDNFNDFDTVPRQPAPVAEAVLPEPPASHGGASFYPKFGELAEPVQSKRAKAAEEARLKAEAEADARAEAKAEAEARRQAEADARAEAKAQAEARKQAEADARAEAKAEAEARKQAEANARAEAKAQAEARKQARAEALAEDEEEGEGKGKSKIWIVAIAAVLLLGLGGGFYAVNRKPAATKPVVAEQTVAQSADSTSLTSTAKPKPTPTTAAASTATPATATETAATTEQPTAAPVQSAAMQQQLNANSVLDKSSLRQPSDASAPPPPSGSIDMGNSGATPSVFSSKPAPKVTAAAPSNKVISVAASVMAGRAVSQARPQYPAFARTARVDGTVVLHATISKAGTIENVSVISGPPMLRQAAIDAVKMWRYKPYLLDNEPVEVETTVNVIFVL
jgi:protein TonB